MNALECRQLYAAYDRRDLENGKSILKGISFSLKEGTKLAILGSNGSGKSTLLKALTAMIPTRGEIEICGRDLSGMKRKEIASRVSYMTQVSQIFFSYTVYETVLMGRYLHGSGFFGGYTPRDREIVENCLKRTGILSLAKRQLSSLSGGELQRTFLARTFAQDAPILMLDEPANHLDLKVVAGMTDYLLEWSSEEGHTLIGVYHDIPLAMRLADSLLLIKDGSLCGFGEKKELLEEGLLEKTYDFDVISYLKQQAL